MLRAFGAAADACLLSPGHLPPVITVAASDNTDTRWSYSNYGTCVDLYAPGVNILSAMYTTPTATLVASGTSMACPLASGAVAQYLQLDPTASPAQVSCCTVPFWRCKHMLLTAMLGASRTSMPCPLVSGAVAQCLQLDPIASPAQVSCSTMNCQQCTSCVQPRSWPVGRRRPTR